MAYQVVLILVLVVTGISEISSRLIAINQHESPVTSIAELPQVFQAFYNTFRCPAIYGRYPAPGNCENFYQCSFGVAILMRCNRGYLYDSKRKQCRDKRRVECHIGEKDQNNQEEIDENYFRCPYVRGTFAHPTRCSQYFVCSNNQPKLHQCYKGFLYDDRIRKCLPKSRVNCGKRVDIDQMKTSKNPRITTTTVKPEGTTVAEILTTTEDPVRPITISSTTAAPLTTVNIIIPVTVAKILESTTISSDQPTSTLSTLVPSSTTIAQKTTEERLPTTTTPVPTTTTSVPTTTTSVPTTTTSVPTTTKTAPTSIPTTTTSVPTTTKTAPTSIPTTASTAATIFPITTSVLTTTTTPVEEQTSSFSVSTETELPVTKPNTPPPTDCDEDDLDCLIDETGDVSGWFDCPKKFGHFPHGSSKQLFIHCDNWRPFVKKCADETVFSPQYLVCVWVDKNKGI